MSSIVSDQTKSQIAGMINNYRFLLAFICGLVITLIFGALLKTWMIIIISGIVCGLYYKRILMGIVTGFLANIIAWALFFLYYMLFYPAALTFGDVFLSLAGADGLGFVVIILTLLIGGIGGLIGGYIGSAIHPFIPWPKWEKSLS